MNILVVIAMAVFAPLNFLLLAPQGVFFNAPVAKSVTEENRGEVRGVEVAKAAKFTERVEPQAPPQPIRKSGIADLKVPNAYASLILDVDSGTILHYSNGQERRQIASLTKVMTAILVMERVKDLNEVVTIDADAVYTIGTRVGCPTSGNCITQRLKVGEKISVLNLMKAMLMNSANDAAIALSKHVSGTEEKFVALMNEKAKAMDLKDTHFCSASGLEPDGREMECYSSAYDVARIGAYSMRFSLIWDIFRLPNNTEVQSADGSCTHTILNTDLLLNEIPQCLGGKTGFTPLAGKSLLLAASDESNKHRIIAVVLNDPYRWEDVKRMLNWAFQSYEWK